MAHILIIDDEKDVRLVLARMLEFAGHQTVEAENGKQAISMLRSQPVDLVITDLVMPEQEGIETIKIVRSNYPDLKIIAMSGAFGGEFLAVAGMLGANTTLQKPLRMETVLAAVGKVLGSDGKP